MILRLIPMLMMVMLFPLAAILGGCDSEAAEVKEVDDAYDIALDTQNGKVAAGFLSKSSIARLDRLVDLARKGSRSKVEALGIGDRIEVLRIRLLLDAPELKKITGREYYIKAVNEGWQGSTSSHEREKVMVNNDRATIIYWDPVAKVRSRGSYVMEDGMWKEEPTPEEDDAALLDEARTRSMSEKEFVNFILCEISGLEEIPDSLWSPPK